ncbi:MAG: AAA family ATPase [bacterium]|nr:AAA family ATPase [bacterium]
MRKEIITINGFPGSGKSSTSDGVARALQYKRFSSGDFFRQVGIELGLSVNEVNKRAETDKTIDEMTDQKLRDLRNAEKIVVDSRTAFHWIPDSFGVYLELPAEIAKERILENLKTNSLRQQSEHAETEEEVYSQIVERLASENKRYMELYGIDNTKKENYDLVIDTNKNNLSEVVGLIITEYKKWLNEK